LAETLHQFISASNRRSPPPRHRLLEAVQKVIESHNREITKRWSKKGYTRSPASAPRQGEMTPCPRSILRRRRLTRIWAAALDFETRAAEPRNRAK
jgi:hypothetical protein